MAKVVGATIYALCDPETREIRYIGKATRLRNRVWTHVYHAERGSQTHCARWIRSIGKPAVLPLVVVPVGHGAEMERRAIAHFRALGYRLTNLTDGGEGAPGWIPSAETRARIGAANRGNVLPPRSAEYRAKMSAAVRGRTPSVETRAKLSAKATGRLHSAETKAKIGAACVAGLTPERRAKISAGNRAKAPFTSEHRSRLGDANRRRTISPATRAKIAAAQRAAWAREESRAARRALNLGRIPTPETRAKMSAAQSALWASRTPERRAEISAGRRGRVLAPRSAEYLAKQRAAWVRRKAVA